MATITIVEYYGEINAEFGVITFGIVLSAPHPVGVSVRVKKNQQANIEYKSAEKVLIS